MSNTSSLSSSSPSAYEAFLAAINYWASGDARRDIEARDAANARELELYRSDRAYDAATSGYGEAC